ncbi:hypothetical protein P4574_23655 [Priestia megaterium]|uniref:hypothetical protein n=1 Tax=Priestia megaterium TaxID=1404 RepID=UPI002E1F0389|nr:hypothetical protein [Priestia megaterium]
MLLLTAIEEKQKLLEQVNNIQKDQLSFLNDTLSNTLSIVGIGVSIITLVFTGVGVFIGYSNQKAKKRMEEAERAINQAKIALDEFSEQKAELEDYRAELEEYRGDLENRRAELDYYQKEVRDYRVETNTKFAELTELGKEIAKLKEDTQIIIMKARGKYILEVTEKTIEAAYESYEKLKDIEGESVSSAIENFEKCKEEFKLLRRDFLFETKDTYMDNFEKIKEVFSSVSDFQDKAIMVTIEVNDLRMRLIESKIENSTFRGRIII